MGDELVVRFNQRRADALAPLADAGLDEAAASDADTLTVGMDVLGGQLAYVSHAHSDHSSAVGGPVPVFCSEQTATLLGLGPVNAALRPVDEEPEERPWAVPASAVKEPFAMPTSGMGAALRAGGLGARTAGGRKTARRRRVTGGGGRIGIPQGISLEPAGHILGATQLVADSPTHGRLVYTGDFKLRDGLTVKGAPIISCDTLIAECTYGDPSVSFPPADQTWSDMARWSRQNAGAIQLWGGYATGKAQEIVKFLNDYLDIEPVVSGRLAQVCAHYVTHGVKLRWLNAESEEAQEVMRGPFSAVLPPHVLTPQLAGHIAAAHRRKALTAMATGWAMVRPMSCSAAFPISDHADFGQLVEYAAGCGAKTIYLAHGDNAHTAKALRAAGYHALPIEQRLGRQLALEVQ